MGSRVFVGSCGGTFYAVEAATGEVFWRHDTAAEGAPSTFHGGVLVAGGLVITAGDGSADAHLLAFEPETGKLRWKRPAPPSGVSMDLAGDDHTVFAVTNGGEVWALDTATGELRWKAALPAGPRNRGGKVAFDGVQVVVAEPQGLVLALDAATGRERWRTPVGEPLLGQASLRPGALVLRTVDGEVLRLNPSSGAVNARHAAVPGPVFGGLAMADRCQVEMVAPRTVACLDPETHNPRWQAKTPSDLTTFQPVIRGHEVWVGDEGGRLSAFDLGDGHEVRYLFAPGIPRGLGTDGRRLFVGTLSGAFVSYDLEPAARAAK